MSAIAIFRQESGIVVTVRYNPEIAGQYHRSRREARFMSILDLFRSKEKPDLDQSVLVQLRKAGSDLSKPHNIEFFLYFPTRSVAEKAASPIRDAGFEVDVKRAAQGDTWLCFATKTMVPELPDLQKIRLNFVTLAVSMSGEYDGWGTEVVKSQSGQ